MTYNRSHNRYLRYGRFARVRHSDQVLAFLTAQATRLASSRTGKTASTVHVSNVDASGLLTFAGQPSTTETVTIGSTTFTFKSSLTGVRASGTLTNDGTNVTDGDTVTIGGKVYTLQSSLTNVDGHVKIGLSNTATMTNLFHAINASGGTVGTDYATATVANTQVTATNPSGTTVVVTAIAYGTVGNSIATTETSSHLSWGAVTLASGVNSVAGEVFIDDTAAHTRDNLLHAITYDATAGTNAGTKYSSLFTVANTEVTAAAASGNLTVTSLTHGRAGDNIGTSSTASNLTWGDTHLTGGVDESFGPSVTATGHGYTDLEGPFELTTSSALPTGWAASTLYWVRVIDANTVKLGTSIANLRNSTFVTATSAGAGTQTLKRSVQPSGVYELLRKNKPESILAASDIDSLH